MRYGSVCSGIEAATVAWHPLGWEPAFFSEIEAAPRAVLALHYATVPLHGDFTTIKGDEYGPTPRECERLQGFPDDYSLVSSRNRMMADGPRYKALGNSMAVPVMAWIGQRIATVDALLARAALGEAA